MTSALKPDDDERQLIKRAAAGEREAFGTLVERYQRRVVSVARALVHNPDDAVELGQETFIRAFQSLPRFEARSSFATWLYRIAANLAIDWRRREGRHLVMHGDEAQAELERVPAPQADAFTTTARGELGAKLNQALDELTPDHRAVILLREVDGLSYDEISDILGCPKGTVMSRLHYARNRLRELLKDVRMN